MQCRLYSLVLLAVFLTPCCLSDMHLSSHVIMEPYDFLFDNAVEAYYKSDWMTVILNMEKALRNKATIRRVKAHCRITCANQTAFGDSLPGLGVPIPGVGSVEDLGFFQNIMKRAECVNTCENLKLGPSSLHKVSEDIKLEFKKRTPYNYLQVAYFKINKLDKAVAAANTFFLANPDHTEMKQNLDYYRMMAGVQEEDFKDLESMPHMAEFLLGKRYYSDDSFAQAYDHFETALEEYFSADRECRVLCEGAYDYDGYNYMEYHADLFQAMTDQYIHVLNCKQRCSIELASSAGRDKPFEDFLPSHLNYLQFSYYNSEKYEKAIECAKAFLLFHPQDEVMNQNLAYYSAVLGEEKAAAIPARQVVKDYIQQSILEKKLLYFGYDVFGISFVDPDTWTPEEVMPLKLREKQKVERETAARITEEIGNLMKEIETLVEEKNKDATTDLAHVIQEGGPVLYDDIKVTMTSKQLNGSQRVLLDGVITDDECRELHRLSNAAALQGDGYRGRPSPHTPGEMFQGVTVLKAVKLGQEGTVSLRSARLFFDLSEKVRRVLESYFRLDSPLYFSYSHLVCRSAIDEKQEERDDLSHPVHADNCQLVSELNECVKEPPAYTHRDYSAILYLNDDFEGGDLIFTELDAKTVTAEVRPQCGRVVGFGAGKENPHGVRAVTRGQRCAVALWFTLDPDHQEKERIQADEMLKMFATPVDAEFMRPTPEAAVTAETARTDRAVAATTDAPSTSPEPGEASAAEQSVPGEKLEEPTKTKSERANDKMEDKPIAEPKANAKVRGAGQSKAASPEVATNTAAPPGNKAKAKTTVKAGVKPAKTGGKTAVKAKSTQGAAKPAAAAAASAKKTVKATVKKNSKAVTTAPPTASESPNHKEEL